MENENWKIWSKNASVEQRTFKRVVGELPEMECTKQLVKIISELYKPEMSILDVGCAAGHYYNGLRRINENVKYWGVDVTKEYIDFAKEHFKNNNNVQFSEEDIFNLPSNFNNKFDIVYCCNVILHLPSFQDPFLNLIRATKKYCIIRTLVAEKTHLSQFLYSDSFDENGYPTDFAYQNTYSYKMIEEFIADIGNYKIKFLDDIYDEMKIINEYRDFNSIQNAVTTVKNNIQTAGSKVFEWKWILIEK
jgi:ubiquinone/menaquinone biosynthesis C-methylase UbiE